MTPMRALLPVVAILAACLPAALAQQTDVLRGAVDPYDFGRERVRFLQAAGVDSELDEQEFKANNSAADAFVRAFDTWPALRAFDRSANGAIDWFEADAYRKALRDAVLRAYDKNSNRRLDGDERDAAGADLAAGKAPRLDAPKAERADANAADAPQAQPQPQPLVIRNGGAGAIRLGDINREWDTDGDGQMSDAEREAYTKAQQEKWAKWQADYIKKWDTNGDGKVDAQEQQAASKAAYDEWKLKNPEQAARYEQQRAEWEQKQREWIAKYDKDGDGKLNAQEQQASHQAHMDAWKERDPEGYARWDKQQKEYIAKYDTDGDGKLSQSEQEDAWAAQREQWRRQQEETQRKYDADGDGKLSAEETQAMYAAQREEARKRYEEYVKQHDKDGDGKLSREEQEAAWKSQGGAYRVWSSGGWGGGGGFSPQQ